MLDRKQKLMIGGKAISCIDYDTWLKKPVLKQAAIKKAKNEKPIINPIFIECIKDLTDNFWIDIFKKAAIGKMVPFFGFNNNNLIFKKDQKEFSINFDDIKPDLLTMTIISFFKKHGNIYSQNDISPPIDDEEEEVEDFEEEEISWTSVNKKNQINMLYTFISDTKEKYNLNEKQTTQLKNVVMTNFSNKLINKNNIIIKDNRIDNISDVFFNKKDKSFFINPELKVKPVKINKKISAANENNVICDINKTPFLMAEWEKYQQYIENKIEIYQRLNEMVVSNVTKKKIIISKIPH